MLSFDNKTHCATCGLAFPILARGHIGGTGYGVSGDCEKTRHCYACCAAFERDYMTKHGRATLYLIGDERQGWKITDWPGELKILPTHVRKLRHPFARQAWLVYFRGPDGKQWSGKNIGDSQLLRCRRLKS